MNTTDLIERIAADHELTKTQARKMIEAVFGAIIEAATRGDEVALSGFGRFKVAERGARQGRNPARLGLLS
jgi:DNA-binding protein HU-beta